MKTFAPLLPMPVETKAFKAPPDFAAKGGPRAEVSSDADYDPAQIELAEQTLHSYRGNRIIDAGYADLIVETGTGYSPRDERQGSAGVSITSALGRGEQLSPGELEKFEHGYQVDLSGVEVHRSSPLVADLGAYALAVGNHVAFAPGRYRPGTPDGEHLLGHELAHTVQQAGAAVGPGADVLELEADDAATMVLAGGLAPALSSTQSGTVQLYPAPRPPGSTNPTLPGSGQAVSNNPFPDAAAAGRKEGSDLSQIGPGHDDASKIEILSNENSSADGSRSFSYHSQASGSGAKGSLNTTTDLLLEYKPPEEIAGGPGIVLVNPEMPYPVPAGPGKPPLPIQLHYSRTMSYSDSYGRAVTVTVRSVVGFSLDTWSDQMSLRIAALDLEGLMALKGESGKCSVFINGTGPLQPYVAWADNGGVSIDIQMILAAQGLRDSLFSIASAVPPAFLWPTLSGGEQFASMSDYLKSADLIETKRRVELERKRREDLGILGRFLEDTGLDKVLDAGARAMASGITWVLDGIVNLWNSLPAPVRGVLEAVGKFAAVVVLVVAGAYLAVEVAAAVGITLTVTAAALAIGGLLMAVGYAGALLSRAKESGETGEGDAGDVLILSIFDTLGIAPFIEAITDESLLSGRKYNRTPEERWEAGTSGLLQMIAVIFGIKELAGKKPPLVESSPPVETGPIIEPPGNVVPRTELPKPELPKAEPTPEIEPPEPKPTEIEPTQSEPGPEQPSLQTEPTKEPPQLESPQPESPTTAVPKKWEKFDPTNNDAFKARLKEFRGNDNLDPDFSGGEGRIFEAKGKTTALKRWFKSRLVDMPESLSKLDRVKIDVDSNPTLSADIEVVQIYERGPDWILRDFEFSSVELKAAGSAAEGARARAIAELEGIKKSGGLTEMLADVLKKLRKHPPSANLHWSPSKSKIVIIDMQ